METANSTFRELTRKEHEFMARADRDLAARRQQNFINQLKKHPQFKPSMLEPPKPKFKAVSLDNGPIVRTHSRRSECCRHSTPQRAAPQLAARLQGGRRAPACQRRGVAPLHRAGRRQRRDFFARRERGGHAARLRCDCRDGVAPRDADRVDAPGEQGAVFVAS